MSNARNLANLLGTGTQVTTADIADGAFQANKNLIINGAMQVWQRGTSQTTSGGYGADRFWMANAVSASRSTDAPAGFTYSTKLTYSAATMSIGQPIELATTGNSAPMVAGHQVTVSFYAKVDSGTEDFVVALNFRDIKFSATNQAAFSAAGGNSLTATTTWQRLEKTFTVPAVNGTNVLAGLEVGNLEKDFYITGVQLELGDTATPFEHRSYGDELLRCKRYYQSYGVDDLGYPKVFLWKNGYYESSHFPFEVQLRANPTVSISGLIYRDLNDATDNSLSGQYISAEPKGFVLGSTTTNNANFYSFTVTPPITVDAEL